MTISVVIPVYNVAPYVERCLSSVMRQSLPATECIIVDDASTDNSVYNTNRGLSAARNTGTDAATSSHIYYLDSDDEMTPDCLQKLAAPISRDDTIEMVMGSSRRDWSDMHGQRARLKQRINIRRARWQSQHPHKPLQLNSNDAVYRWYFIRCLRHAVIIPDVTYIHHQRPAETKNRLPGFLRNYAEACGDEDYEYSFNIFLNQMSVSNNKCSVWKMKLVRHIARKKLEK